MSLISPSDQQKLREHFSGMTRPVRLLFFTQTLGCETCLQTREILDELPPLSDRIVIEEVNLILEGDRGRHYRVDRAPAIAIEYRDGEGQLDAVWVDSRMRFLGAPAGYEFISLAQAVLLAGGGPSNLSESSRRQIAAVDRPVVMNVFTTPT